MKHYCNRKTGEVEALQRDDIGLWRCVPARRVVVEDGVVDTWELMKESDWEECDHQPMSDDEMRTYIRAARQRAAPVGPLHSFWDMIFDAEEILGGRRSILNRPTIEMMFRKYMPEVAAAGETRGEPPQAIE